MKKLLCIKRLLSLLLIITLILLGATGCAPQIKQVLPKMERERVTLPVKLSPKPYLPLTDAQVAKLWNFDKDITKTIFDNQAEWFVIYDEAQVIQKGYEDYLADIFSGDKKK